MMIKVIGLTKYYGSKPAAKDISFEVIIVDSGSTDDTIRIVKSFDVDKIVKLDYFKPGYAINEGVKASNGKFIVILSAVLVVSVILNKPPFTFIE